MQECILHEIRIGVVRVVSGGDRIKCTAVSVFRVEVHQEEERGAVLESLLSVYALSWLALVILESS